ncbi:MAG: hypothetical protein ABIP50_03505 [Candidatus Saccharimonadales bacterium]
MINSETVPPIEGLRIPMLNWTDPSYPGPIRQLEASREVEATLPEALGREPTPEEHHAAFQRALGELTVEVTHEQRRAAVVKAKEQIKELMEFVEKYGGQDE